MRATDSIASRPQLGGRPALVTSIAAYVLIGSAITLCGWAFDLRRLTDWNNDGISMFINTALCAIAAAAALLLLVRPTDPARDWMVRAAATFTAIFGGLTLCEHLFGWNLGIDTLFGSRDWGQHAATAPMRMGPPASVSFVLIGAALILATLGAQPRRVAAVLAILPAAIAGLSITGYMFGANQLFGVARFTGIAWQSSTMLAALGIGIAATIPEYGVTRVLLRDDAGGALLRRLIVPIVAVPLILGWLRIRGQHVGLFDLEFGTALRTLIEITLLFALLCWTSVSVSRYAAATHEAQSRLAAIVESSDDPIIGMSLDGVIDSWNAAAQRLFGYAPREAVGRHISLLIPSNRVAEEHQILGRIAQGQGVEHFETVRMCKDGKHLDVSLTVSPIRSTSGRIVGASKIARDITQQKRVEKAIRQSFEAERAARAEADRINIMKDEFLATLSHELRTPLSAILGWSQLLATEKLEQAETTEGLQAIERNARAQTQLIDDLLDMSRIISGKVRLELQPTDLASVVELAVNSVKPTAEAKQIVLHKITDPYAGPVSGDATRLQQIVWNLLTNAIKFTPKGGAVEVLLQRINSHVEIAVRDTGIGIKPEFLPHVFERFRQADSSTTRPVGGLGLGLSIVKNLVELHGGNIRALSEGEGKGATFIVALPLSPVRVGDPLASQPPPAIEGDRIRLSGIKVLVVDDEPDARELIKRLLVQREAQVVTARDAAEGLELLRRQRPDVLISDIGMPDKDGYQFLRDVRNLPTEEGGKTPAIALTAFARSEDRTRAVIAGYQVHIAKPIDVRELIATVASVAGRMLSS